ncbi:MAG: hypothetical protein GYA23_08185 [Methanomicrobiales archaeon]|nr:hypothetical protein [Methanomicrobiales archaeon]
MMNATTGSKNAPVLVQQGMITVIFETGQKSARPSMLTLKNEFQEIIHTSFHAHMAGEVGLEIILVRGDVARFRALEQQLMGRRGIRSARLTLIPS